MNWITTGEEPGTRRRTDWGRRVELREPYASGRNGVDVWSSNVFGAVAAGIDTALVISEDDDDIGLACICMRAGSEHEPGGEERISRFHNSSIIGLPFDCDQRIVRQPILGGCVGPSSITRIPVR